MHASSEGLTRIESLLHELRKRAITERKPGIFYLKSTAFLHFHEDADVLYAHLKIGKVFEKFSVNTEAEQAILMKEVDRVL